jgi:hypothetical protein
MVAVRKDYAAPMGLEFCLGCGSTMMPRLRRYGRSRTTKPRPARQNIRFPAGANAAQAFGHDAQVWAKYQCQSHACKFSGGILKSLF